MFLTLATLLIASSALNAHTDTSFVVPQGARLVVQNFGGDIVVKAWGKNAVRVQADHSERAQIGVDRSGSSYEVRATTRRGIPARVDYQIMAPAWMALSLGGVYTDVSVEGFKSDVIAETVKGDVVVNGGEGLLRLTSVEGDVKSTGARGRIQASSVNQGVTVIDAIGDLTIEAVNGDVVLKHVLSKLLDASTVNGDVSFSGVIAEGGRYRFASHNGDIDVALSTRVNATISVSTYSGDFESNFPVTLNETKKGRQFSFTLGSGKAVLDLETFQGSINLRRSEAADEKE